MGSVGSSAMAITLSMCHQFLWEDSSIGHRGFDRFPQLDHRHCVIAAPVLSVLKH
jgi:hypothetical protein